MTYNLGRKIRNSAKKSFGKKTARNLSNFGKKLTHQIDVGERKLTNSIDKITPFIAAGSDLYLPGSGKAINGINDGIQSLHTSGRGVINQIPKIGASHANNAKKAVINFGDDIKSDARKEYNRSKSILASAGNQIQNNVKHNIQDKMSRYERNHIL